MAAKNPVEMTAEELADEEWGSTKEKGKKAKKGKNKKGKAQAESDVEEKEGCFVFFSLSAMNFSAKETYCYSSSGCHACTFNSSCPFPSTGSKAGRRGWGRWWS